MSCVSVVNCPPNCWPVPCYSWGRWRRPPPTMFGIKRVSKCLRLVVLGLSCQQRSREGPLLPYRMGRARPTGRLGPVTDYKNILRSTLSKRGERRGEMKYGEPETMQNFSLNFKGSTARVFKKAQ